MWYFTNTMQEILRKINRQAEAMGRQVYVVGGALRDLLLGKEAPDLDLAIDHDALGFGARLAVSCDARFVVLDDIEEVGRLIWHGHLLDLAVFKDHAATIEEDLRKRDFTINAMAMTLPDWLRADGSGRIVDPCGGREDMRQKIIRRVSGDEALRDDPLRMLRAFRLQARTGFRLADRFLELACRQRGLLRRSAPERISSELHLIMESSRASQVVGAMLESRILAQVCPEISSGAGVEQPASHHLDVLGHNLAALAAMDEIISQPHHFFPEAAPVLVAYLQSSRHQRWLRWAALFHDMAKPQTRAIKKGRITFYQHDTVGARLFREMANRLRFAKIDRERIALFIGQHMRPFHLCNVMRKGPVSARACLRLAKTIGDDLPGLFLLAMADSLAGKGEARPPNMESELAELFGQVHRQMVENIAPLLLAPPLLNGDDLIAAGLRPGPLFRTILDDLQQAQVSGEVTDRDAALAWLAVYKERLAIS